MSDDQLVCYGLKSHPSPHLLSLKSHPWPYLNLFSMDGIWDPLSWWLQAMRKSLEDGAVAAVIE